MRYLVPLGGEIDPAFGILTSPSHFGIPAGIAAGMDWAADNGAFSGAFDPSVFSEWLIGMEMYADTCLFVAVPDVIGDSRATLEQWREYSPLFQRWPLAFVCQDGQVPDDIPSNAAAVFIGGTTSWKLSRHAIECIAEGTRRGNHIHIGRVNYRRRYRHFATLNGSSNWTCDGTRTRYDGRDRALRAWKSYMMEMRCQPKLLSMPDW